MPFRVLDPDYERQALAQIKESVAQSSHDGILRRFDYDIMLPLLLHSAEHELPCHEPISETIAISAHVSARIHAFYNQLAAYYAGLADPKADGIKMVLTILPQKIHEDPYCSHRRFHARRLELHDHKTLPDLPFVTSLIIYSTPDCGGDLETSSMRPLSLLVPLRCLARLPAVEALKLPWAWERPLRYAMPSRVMRDHYSRPWEGPLRDARHEFGAAVLYPEKYLGGHGIPASLTKAALWFWKPSPVSEDDQAMPSPKLIYPADKDPVSLGLRKLAAQLRIFDIRALVTEDLFPPPEAPAEEQWSEMRRLRIEFYPLRPDGRWSFVGPRGEDPHDSEQGGFVISASEHYPREYDIPAVDKALDIEWEDDPTGGVECALKLDMFRTEPCRERIEPLLAAFAKALTRDNMPHLEFAELFAYLWWHPSYERARGYGYGQNQAIECQVHRWGVKYVAGRGDEGGDAVAPTVQWQVGDWRPSQEVMSLFEGLG